MAVAWTPHRFSGGLLALDTTNTVVLRGDPELSFDRFDDPVEIGRFAQAASGFRAQELGGRVLEVDDPHAAHELVIEMRETTDRLFRDGVERGSFKGGLLADFLGATAKALKGSAESFGKAGAPFDDATTPLRFEAALAVSALSLLGDGQLRRVRICQHCRWLFVDRSRNSSRVWCDMAVCGNRTKARRHYQKRRGEEAEHAEG